MPCTLPKPSACHYRASSTSWLMVGTKSNGSISVWLMVCFAAWQQNVLPQSGASSSTWAPGRAIIVPVEIQNRQAGDPTPSYLFRYEMRSSISTLPTTGYKPLWELAFTMNYSSMKTTEQRRQQLRRSNSIGRRTEQVKNQPKIDVVSLTSISIHMITLSNSLKKLNPELWDLAISWMLKGSFEMRSSPIAAFDFSQKRSPYFWHGEKNSRIPKFYTDGFLLGFWNIPTDHEQTYSLPSGS